MWKLMLLAVLFTSLKGLPLEEKTSLADVETTTDNIEQLQNTLNVVSYIQNFKNIMADYVNTQYKNLTIHDMEKIKTTLEDFLVTFANDLKDTVESQQKNVTFENEREKIQDGVTDSTFLEIKNRMKTEFPDMNEETVDEIVYKLRKNLYVTRQKIDTIVYNSLKAQVEYETN